MNTKSRKKYRKNVKEFVDCDYKKKLNPEELEWMNKFEGEYYANELGREGSIHEKALKDKEYTCISCSKKVNAFDEAKKETYNSTNAQNRDSYAISETGSCLKFIEDESFYKELITPTKKVIDLVDPHIAYNLLLEETINEIVDGPGRQTDKILNEFAMEMVKIGASISKLRANKILKRREEKREAKLTKEDNNV